MFYENKPTRALENKKDKIGRPETSRNPRQTGSRWKRLWFEEGGICGVFPLPSWKASKSNMENKK